eukprot:TRINITY_DN16830_c0_g1_i1.p1 TRINITY_DN16830_c0_g1~~TRINITY_DN16830_c0_g1_i1.p1  ORF type:complete len:802 (-),score=200.43 TRINITY_DN16830_c0_g1_i1:201-2498(-)
MAAAKGGECVKVVIRCRPLSTQEKIDNRESIVEMDTKEGVARVKKPGGDEFKDFTFDAVYGDNTIQSQFYEETGYAIVESVMDGYNGTIFAYGQTGTGKTHTMVGPPEPAELAGVIPRTFEHIFNNINVTCTKKFLVRASYLEIYNEEIRDLLSKNPKAKLELKDHPEGGVYVKDLSNLIVKGVADLGQVMEVGQRNRSVASTLMNNESSRSHSIFTITIETAETGADSKEHIRVGKMNMVDLAGSERQSKTGASGETLKEATKINMSLSALGNVISALVDAKTSFIPYRDSKLTRLLQDSLGGNTKTVMCACIGPVDYNYDETLSTLRYAYRAKSIKNKPRINEDPKDAMIREFQDEITRLKMQLANRGPTATAAAPRPAPKEKKPKEPKEPKAAAVPLEPQEQEVIIEKEVVEVEKIVEREVVIEKVVQQGISDEEIAQIQEAVAQERAAIEAAAEEERKAIEEQKDLADAEKAQLLADLQEKKRQRDEEEEAQARMMQQLKAMEDKMLVGSQVMMKAAAQENELKKAEREMLERRRQEDRMKEELEQQVDEKLNLEEKYASTEEQVQKMTAKLEKLWNRHKQTQQEIGDLQQEFQQERDDMLETIRELRKEVKLVIMTTENFIPVEQYKQIADRANYDQSTDEWVIPNIELAGNRVRGQRKRILDDGVSPRPLRGGPEHGDQQSQRAAEQLVNERPNVYWVYTEDGGAQRADTRPAKPKPQRMKSASGRPETANRRGRVAKEDSARPQRSFPQARGLVKGEE